MSQEHISDAWDDASLASPQQASAFPGGDVVGGDVEDLEVEGSRLLPLGSQPRHRGAAVDDGDLDASGELDLDVDQLSDAGDQDRAHHSDTEADDTPAKKKPNYAILAGAGVLVLVAVGAAASIFMRGGSAEQAEAAEQIEIAPVSQQASSGSILTDAASQPVQGQEAVGVLSGAAPSGDGQSSLEKAEALAQASPPAQAVPVAVASAVPVAASTTSTTLATATAQLSAVQAVEPPKVKAAIEPPVIVKPVEAPKPRVVASNQKPRKKSVKLAKKPVVKTDAAVAQAPVEQPRKAAAMRDEERETVVLPDGLQVVAVFPRTGPLAQAWVRDSQGRTYVVAEGSALAGARVTKVDAQAETVTTTAGRITARGR